MELGVWAVEAGVGRRLGRMAPGAVKAFVVPPDMVRGGTLEILVQGTGGGGLRTSRDLFLSPGDEVRVTITAHYEITTDVISH